MTITKEGLRDFTRFADEKLDRGGAISLVELVGEWEAQRHEMEDAVADVRESHTDIDAGRATSVSETFSDIRKQLGLR